MGCLKDEKSIYGRKYSAWHMGGIRYKLRPFLVESHTEQTGVKIPSTRCWHKNGRKRQENVVRGLLQLQGQCALGQ